MERYWEKSFNGGESGKEISEDQWVDLVNVYRVIII
jgi:hypothetical protein